MKNNMTTLDQVMERLSVLNKMDLKSQKIQLSITSDIMDASITLENDVDFGRSLMQEVDENLDNRDEAVENLGRSVSSAKESIGQFAKGISSANKLLKKTEIMAKELGVTPDNINGYQSLKNDIIAAERSIDNLRDSVGMAGRVNQ